MEMLKSSFLFVKSITFASVIMHYELCIMNYKL